MRKRRKQKAIDCIMKLLYIICTFQSCYAAATKTNGVKRCPESKTEWNNEVSSVPCGGTSSYHCLRDIMKDEKKVLCLEKTTIGAGYCPVLVNNQLDWQMCNISGCPTEEIVSDQVYLYPVCYGDNSYQEGSKSQATADALDGGIIAAIVIASVAFIFIVVVSVICIYKRRLEMTGDDKRINESNIGLISHERLDNTQESNSIVRTGTDSLKLNEHKCLLITGKLGSSVKSKAKLIMNLFVGETPAWKTKSCDYKHVPYITPENKTILFIHGWFGKWNDNPCELAEVKKYLNVLWQWTKTKEMKIIVGMRSDYYKKYIHSIEMDGNIRDIFENYINLDTLDVNRDHEQKEYFSLKIHDSVCIVDSCRCGELKYETLAKKDRSVGVHLKITVLGNDHTLIGNFINDVSLLQTFKRHIHQLRKDKRAVYECLMYMMLKGCYKPHEHLDEELLKNVEFSITEETFKENMPLLEKMYIKRSESDDNISSEPSCYEFLHPFHYICAFHSFCGKNPDLTIMHCNLEALLQLIRPENTQGFSDFAFTLKQKHWRLFVETLKGKINTSIEEHPLMKVYRGEDSNTHPKRFHKKLRRKRRREDRGKTL